MQLTTSTLILFGFILIPTTAKSTSSGLLFGTPAPDIELTDNPSPDIILTERVYEVDSVLRAKSQDANKSDLIVEDYKLVVEEYDPSNPDTPTIYLSDSAIVMQEQTDENGATTLTVAQAHTEGFTSPFAPSYLEKKLSSRHYHLSSTKPESLGGNYHSWKNWLKQETGISFAGDISLLNQRAAPNGKGTANQLLFTPSLSWKLFENDKYGSGTINIAYIPTRYWGSTDAVDLQNRIDVLAPINDFPNKSNLFSELSYTQQFAGAADWLSLTLGQFPLYNFDGNDYNANQQQNFINYTLSQNGTSSYPVASLGAYASAQLSSEWNMILGLQDANNISGATVSSSDFGKGDYTSFAYLAYSPLIKGIGQSNYSLLIYNQPSVADALNTSNGWSFNMSQEFGKKWAIFSRINGTTGSTTQAIEQSYALGGVMNNPLGRNTLDQIGFATAINKSNKEVVGDNTRDYETLLETYWAWGIGNFITITPDIQFYINPALDPSQNTATVTSLRTTILF